MLLTTIYFLVAFTKGDQIKSDLIDIPNQISPTTFDTFSNESDLNEAESIKNQPKVRRKRYVAFPEGSSFSVTLFLNIITFISYSIVLLIPILDSSMRNDRFNWKSKVYLYDMGTELGLSIW